MLDPQNQLTAPFEPRPHDGPRERHAPAPSHVRCRFAKDAVPAPGLTGELTSVLRTRLRLAILIILVSFILHFVRNLFLRGPGVDDHPSWFLYPAAEIIVMATASVLLWSRRPLGMKVLRGIEVVIFAALALFIAALQIEAYHKGFLAHAVAPGQEERVYRLIGVASVLRWCLVMVLYGTFIPNTWRRCALIVGVLASIPIVLMVGACLGDRTLAPYILPGIPENVIILATASAIAVFGSHKIRQLQEKAHEAERIGQYRLKQILGFGGMGAVYLAEHVLLRRPCAIKLIRPDQVGDPRTLLRFEREVQATATLTHWNTIEIFDYGHSEDGTFYYVMEYLPGLNLEDLVDQHGPMPPERAVSLLRQVCQALREAHAIGLVHRDIKPSNIIACERGRVYDVAKLLDFGLVKGSAAAGDVQLTREGTMAGSPAFMSPEQAAALPQIDARCDIYSVGAVAYFLTTGQLVFDRDSTLKMLHAHAYEPLEPAAKFYSDVPPDLQTVILRCLEKEPARRYQDAESLDKALSACACAVLWTNERAQDWWRQHEAGNGALPAGGHPGLSHNSSPTASLTRAAGPR
jgi:serine/threonine-protein kinase